MVNSNGLVEREEGPFLGEGHFHEQADTGLGFACDRLIVGVIRAFNRIPGLKSWCSCQHCLLGGIDIDFTADFPSQMEKFRRDLEASAFRFRLYASSFSGKLVFEPGTDPDAIEEAFGRFNRSD